METIYFTYDDLKKFLLSKQMHFTKKYEKQSQQRNIALQFKELQLIGKRKVLFISQLQEISMPNDAFFPQLRTLYGVPAGLLVSRNEIFDYNPKNTKDELQAFDIFYLAQRRAFLYAAVWGIKTLDLSRVELFFNSYLKKISPPTVTLYYSLLENIAQLQQLPIQKPSIETINDTVSDYQLIWFGKIVGKTLLNGNKMTVKQREWFININSKDIKKGEKLFGDAYLLIIAYRLVMMMYNADRMNVATGMQLVTQLTDIHPNDKTNILLLTLLIIGILDKKADNYFMVAGATQLFTSIEKNTFEFLQTRNFESFDFNGFDAVKDAMLQKHENCVAYYQMKNPNISHKQWELFNIDGQTKWPDVLPLIKPADIIHFLFNNDKVFSMDTFFNKTLIITSNEQFYMLLKNAANVVFYDGVIFRSNVAHWEKNQPIYIDNDEWKAKFSFLSKKIMNSNDTFKHLHDEWVLITSDFKLPTLSQTMLLKMAEVCHPTSIYIFNFNSNLNNIGLKWNKASNIKKDLFSEEHENTGLAKSDFQSQIETMFAPAKVRIISKSKEDLPWEMVATGINVLQKTTLNKCLIIETRFDDKLKIDYEIIMRSFSDIIVYDEEQRYMFMNL